ALDELVPQPPRVVRLRGVGTARDAQLLEPYELDLSTLRGGGLERLLEQDLGAARELAAADSQEAAHVCSVCSLMDRMQELDPVWPGSTDYDAARAIWNAMHDRRPAVVLRPRTPAGVAAAIAYAR